MSISTTPFMAGVTGGPANSPQSLQSLISALVETSKPSQLANPSAQLRCSYIQIQADPNGGGAKYYIGNRANMTASDCGVALVAFQPWQPPALAGNWYRLDQIYLMSDTPSALWLICFVTK